MLLKFMKNYQLIMIFVENSLNLKDYAQNH
jgi:hypothetical protein